MAIALVTIGIVLCIALSAYFSAAEMAISSCNLVRLENEEKAGSRGAGLARKLAEHYDDTLSAILIGNNLVNIAASSLTAVLIIMLTGSDALNWLGTVIVTVLIIICGETIPKIAAKKYANRFSASCAGGITAVAFVVKPLIVVVVAVTNLLTKRLGNDEPDAEEYVEELQSIIEAAEDEGVLDKDRTEMVQAAIDFSEISASEVMTARVDVMGIDINDSREEVISKALSSTHSRMPVYDGSIDNVIGVVHLNHLLRSLANPTGNPTGGRWCGQVENPTGGRWCGELAENGSAAISSAAGQPADPLDDIAESIREIMMPPEFVYKTTKLPVVLNELKKARQHLAIVTDEYSGTLGVITMEDVLEQIVGEIWDDTDEIEQEVVTKDNGTFEIDGDMAISDFLELFSLNEETFDFESETAGGFVIELNGTFPEVGTTLTYGDITMRVLEMDGRRVEKIFVSRN